MKRVLNRLVLNIGSVILLGLAISCRPASQASATQVALAAQTQPSEMAVLEGQAVGAVRQGNFTRGDQLLVQAEQISHDPQAEQMDQWVEQFQAQEKTFADQRHKEFERAVNGTRVLLAHHQDSYAIDEASQAFQLSDDKDGFRHEKWIDDLIQESIAGAKQDEADGLWFKALRIYADLATLEPSTPMWKDDMKVATRRVRLVLEYAPQRFKKLQAVEAHDRQQADELLRAATQPSVAQGPATKPLAAAATQPDDDSAADATDWHDMVRGIKYDMLLDVLELADHQYYKQVTYQKLMEGGLEGIRVVLTTDALADAFPGLRDAQQRDKLLAAVDEWTADAQAAKPQNAEDVLSQCLSKLRQVNQDTVKLPEGVFVSEFADGALSQLDPFSTVIWPYDMEELEKTTEGEFGGVGIQIESDDSRNLKVVQPLEDTPASRAGVRPNDIITRINGKNAKGISLDGAVKVITGVPGTTVTLTIRSADGTVKDYLLRREMIKVASVKGFLPKPNGGWDYLIDPQRKIGYIRITSFSKTTADDLGQALEDLKANNAQAVILDLRDNPGGLLQQAIEVVNKFIDSGVIVSTHADRPTVNAPTSASAVPENLQTTLPLVVLVDQFSASASEIVSGALKDHHRALLVGERTFGKGSVQMLLPLDANRADMAMEARKACLKLTTSHYYLPSGRCIHREEDSTTWGVDPDVVVQVTPEQMGAKLDARMALDIPGADAGNSKTPPTVAGLFKVDPQLSAALLILRLQLVQDQPDIATAAK